jgi:monovalent cation/hydrogen antiporter
MEIQRMALAVGVRDSRDDRFSSSEDGRVTDSLYMYLLTLAVGCGLAAVAKRIKIPYPIVLVPAGVLLSFIPSIPEVPMNAEIALNCFLPLLVYAGVVSSSWRDFLADIRAISLLAVGHVIFATAVVAAVAHFFIPGFPWPQALVLGAVVAPPDEVAAIQLLRRLGIPHRLLSILEGEGMANDATSLTIYRIAVAAIATNRIVFSNAMVLFGSVVVGEVAWGLAVGWLVTMIRKKVNDASIASVLSVLTPFLAYIPAEKLGGSGILATVVAGFYVGTQSHTSFSPRMRVRDTNIWSSINFLLNCWLFILTGLQLRGIVARQHDVSLIQMCVYALAISAVLVVARFVWVFPAAYLPRWLFPSIRQRDPYPPWQFPFVIAFTGLRGAISLAAALALPLAINGEPLAARDLIIFLTFSAILTTLVLQGLSLPYLIRRLGLTSRVAKEDEDERKMELKARLAATCAGLAELERLNDCPAGPHFLIYLRRQYDNRLALLRARTGAQESTGQNEKIVRFMSTVRSAERQALIGLQEKGTISDRVMARIEEDVDLEDLKFEEEE